MTEVGPPDVPAVPAARVVRYTHVWHWRKWRGDRKGDPCRVLVRARTNGAILVEFEDGERVVTSRWAVRRR